MKISLTKPLKPVWLIGLSIILIQLQVIAQQGDAVVTGTVTGDNNEPLVGVTVKATNNASKESYSTTTDEKGIFTFNNLRLGSSYSIIASYVGYATSTIKTSPRQGNNSMLIKLSQSTNSLNEVVVIGYGTQRRETVTGAITTVRAKDFNSGQINDPMTLVAGKVAGLSLSNSSRSDPNATADFSLRGPATATGPNPGPLVVIDGVPGGDLQTIAPNDIASIDVLKDGSAAAIYGSQATAGVIIIYY